MFCSDSCRSRHQGAKFRQPKRRDGIITSARAISDSAAALHPGEIQRPFLSSIDEPPELRDELRPPSPARTRADQILVFGVSTVSGWLEVAVSLGFPLTNA
jgi:hypothetical protein